MKTILFLVCLFSLGFCFSQKSTLGVINLETHKEKVLKENERIKLATLSGRKMVGRSQIIDKNTIMLNGIPVSLSEIKKIKRHLLISSIGTTVSFTALGIGTTIYVLLGSSLAPNGSSSFAPAIVGLVVVGVSSVYVGVTSLNLYNKGYRGDKKWKFTIQLTK
jgi:hypothetical protein